MDDTDPALREVSGIQDVIEFTNLFARRVPAGDLVTLGSILANVCQTPERGLPIDLSIFHDIDLAYGGKQFPDLAGKYKTTSGGIVDFQPSGHIQPTNGILRLLGHIEVGKQAPAVVAEIELDKMDIIH